MTVKKTMKEFKVGKYYVFDEHGQNMDEATIHGFVEIDGVLHAVLTRILGPQQLTQIVTRPIKTTGETAVISFYGYCLKANAPVLHKPVKFKVGKTYFDKSYEFTATAKYTSPNGRTYLIFEDRHILEVRTNEYNVEYVEFSNANADSEAIRFDARNYVED